MNQALQGIKVADFTWAAAGPQLTRCLADFGATVVRVESNTYPDLLRTTPPYQGKLPGINRSTYFANYNGGKYGMSLNLNHPKAMEIAERLVAWADVLVENFTPGKMGKWGLGYKDLIKIKADIIMVSLSLQGQTGPHAGVPGFAYNSEALIGFYDLIGWSDRLPSTSQAFFGDILAPRLGLSALMAALDYRRRTGKGQYLDLSQIEAAGFILTPLLLDFFANGIMASRQGNSSPEAAPHSVYPCQGEDRWCTLSIFSDEEWCVLCQAMGNPEWAQDPKFATFLGRKENEEELDKSISSWTIRFTPEEVMTLLQQKGLAAGAVSDSRDLSRDPQLQHREAVRYLEHPEIGRQGYDTFSFKLSKTPATIKMSAPCLGEHTEYVCTQILGVNLNEFIQLFNEGVFI